MMYHVIISRAFRLFFLYQRNKKIKINHQLIRYVIHVFSHFKISSRDLTSRRTVTESYEGKDIVVLSSNMDNK